MKLMRERSFFMSKDIKWLKPSRKIWLVIVGIVIALSAVAFIMGFGGRLIGGKSIDFEEIHKDDIPKSIEVEVIPEYRELERALGCLVDDKVYVVVTRGEMETSGYEVSIEKILLETENGKENLSVEANFKDPKEGERHSKTKTYPYVVAKVDLAALPDTIELITKY